jgi:hypothetical protein
VQAFIPGQEKIFGNEDCLAVNVYTKNLPGDNVSPVLTPVMVWIHGGAFVMGNGGLGAHGPERFMDHDVVSEKLFWEHGQITHKRLNLINSKNIIQINQRGNVFES